MWHKKVCTCENSYVPANVVRVQIEGGEHLFTSGEGTISLVEGSPIDIHIYILVRRTMEVQPR